MRELIRGNPEALSQPRMCELLFQLMLKVCYLESVQKKIISEFERMIDCAYKIQDDFKLNCKVILDLQGRLPKDLQTLLREQLTEIEAFLKQQDVLVNVD